MAPRTKSYEEGYPLDTWVDNHKPPKKMGYRDGFFGQIEFIRDEIYPLIIGYSSELFNTCPIKVVGTFDSKSIILPIYGIKIPGIEIRLRGDFSEWIVSIKSDGPIKDDFHGIIKKGEIIPTEHMEGVHKDWIFGSYHQNSRQFSFHVYNEYELFALFLIIMDNLKNA